MYELPFGPAKQFLSLNNPRSLRKAFEGWQVSGVSRVQSGSPFRLTGRATFNAIAGSHDNGVVLYNMTQPELNDLIEIRKTTRLQRLRPGVLPAPGPGQQHRWRPGKWAARR